MLMLTDAEQYFLKQLKDLPIEQGNDVDQSELEAMRSSLEQALAKTHKANPQLGEQVYQAWMGFYNGFLKKLGWTKSKFVEEANHYAIECMKLKTVPKISAKTVGKMGMKGTPGLVVGG